MVMSKDGPRLSDSKEAETFAEMAGYVSDEEC